MKTYDEAMEYLSKYHCFPEEFDQWDLRNQAGSTIAHAYVWRYPLPKTFDKWYLKNHNNTPVFVFWYHVNGEIPDWFNDWDMVITDDGETCREVYERIKE